MYDRKRRRRMLVSGKCDKCPGEAVLPWKGRKYCYKCWNDMMNRIKKESPDNWWSKLKRR